MDKQTNSWNGSPATNQGESSNIDPTIKVGTLIPAVENQVGNESGVSDTAGRGAVAATYSGPTGNDGINGTASTEDMRSPRSKGLESQDVPEAGRNQYQS